MVRPCCRLLPAICYAMAKSGVPELSSPSDQKIARIALIGALVAALGLAGCGRKGGLDPPPAAAVADPAVVAQPGLGPSPEVAPDGRAVAPAQGPQRRTPIDFLLN
jgi:predicted small lipoprotein YifL